MVLLILTRAVAEYSSCTDMEAKTSWCNIIVEMTESLTMLTSLPLNAVDTQVVNDIVKHLSEFPIKEDTLKASVQLFESIKSDSL